MAKEHLKIEPVIPSQQVFKNFFLPKIEMKLNYGSLFFG